MSIEIGAKIDPFELSEYLVEIGYSPMFDCADYGTFSRKGLVFDINPINCDPVRLLFEDDHIKNIHPLNLSNQKSDTQISLNEVIVGPGNAAFLMTQETKFLKRESSEAIKPTKRKVPQTEGYFFTY